MNKEWKNTETNGIEDKKYHSNRKIMINRMHTEYVSGQIVELHTKLKEIVEYLSICRITLLT